MSSEYSYDKENEHWPFYVIVLTGLVTLPVTYSLFPSKIASAAAPKVTTDFRPKDGDLIASQRKALMRKNRRTWSILIAVGGWSVLIYMSYLIATAHRTPPKIYNPYDILGISESATEKEIKKWYKRLSLKFHPDKIRLDASKNETIEDVNAKYAELTQAYQALTDEVVRENVINFGHPDGKQPFSYGIALPSWLVQDQRVTALVMGLYSFLFLLMLPYAVGSWWYGLQRVSKDGVLMESANNLFREYKEDTDEGGVITALSVGKEFEEHASKIDESHLTKLESRILAEGELGPFAGGLTVKDKTKLEDLDDADRRKVLALLWAYLGRIDLDDPALNAFKYKFAPIAHSLANSFTSIALAYGNAGPILAAFRTSQHLIQAVPPNASPLLQLPYFTPKVIRSIEGDSRLHHTIEQFMDLPDTKRRKLAVGHGLLSENEYKTAVDVSLQLPYFRVAKAFFKVTGEKFIIPSSLVSLVVKGRFIPPGSEKVPEVNEIDLEDIDPPEDDLEALLGKNKNKKIKTVDGKVVIQDETPSLPPKAFAPYYVREHAPKWSVFLTDSKQGKMAVPPFTFTSFDEPITTADGKPTYAMQTLKAQFQAPPQRGQYTFVMHVICDSYVGFDTKMEVTLKVDDASMAAPQKDDDEISEPDEDTIAGQMQALKTGGLSAPQSKKKAVESDDESGTDDDDNDTSETNTDTEDES
ncbi:hypothetical protein MKZ38_004247 [Zalerion maritima]|uniref:J domain-containing protein n=1 Tax=Zalerion maritima TaxID=339359 RepID=A0AAD5RLT4_9PEZI|nr:hypothetical protein MKZ38_004247 [Zalerion maritima]